jgi:inner membrane protein
LVGGCLALTGLKRRTGLGTAALVIAANLPDLDVLAIPLGRNLELRRGWTHGVLAIAIWPFLLAAALWLWARFRPRLDRPPVWFRGLLLLSVIGVLSHPLLDFLNNYGMRWLMPFRDRWYYGDSLFIVDPWLWALLGFAIRAVRRRERAGDADPGRPARLALAGAVTYVGIMMASTLLARGAIRRELGHQVRFMAAAVPITPFTKQVIVDAGDRYRIGRYRFLGSPGLVIDTFVAKGGDRRAAAAVAATRAGKGFLHWARFPVYQTAPAGDSLVVRVYDLRYATAVGRSWAAVEVGLARR